MAVCAERMLRDLNKCDHADGKDAISTASGVKWRGCVVGFEA